MDVGGFAFSRCTTRNFVGLAALTIVSLASAEAAQACACPKISPAEGFSRAQYVFTGKVVEAGTHTWVAKVGRVWKGKETLTRMARLMDVYAGMDCEFYFKEGERYLFFAIVAKSPKDVFYHPQVCNLTSPLRSRRVATQDGKSMWLEDVIVKQHGPGGPPTNMDGSGRLP
ncbi:MAG TPA: hypothetical protein VIV09_03320 [Pseudolabrys sp.]